MSTPNCHRFLIGLEQAEAQAHREGSICWDVGVLDPGVDPSDYHWRIAGDDVLFFAVEPVRAQHFQSLGVHLMSEGARYIGIFDHEGECRFWRSPKLSRREVDMKLKVGQLPAGYLALPGCAFHVAKVRKHTADIERLKRHIPWLIELEATEPGSVESHAVLEKVDDMGAFHTSMRQVAALLQLSSGQLADGAA